MPSNKATARAGQLVEMLARCGRGAASRAAGRQLLQRDRQRQERAGEVAAVDRRDVGRRQRRQRARVVPVQQVTLEAFQAFDGRERGLDPVGQIIGVDEAEVVSRERREQPHADVGRRRAVRDGQLRDELDVVGRQRVILGSDERLEVAPRLARDRLRGTRGPRRRAPRGASAPGG